MTTATLVITCIGGVFVGCGLVQGFVRKDFLGAALLIGIGVVFCILGGPGA